jgi:hypothetical protein
MFTGSTASICKSTKGRSGRSGRRAITVIISAVGGHGGHSGHLSITFSSLQIKVTSTRSARSKAGDGSSEKLVDPSDTGLEIGNLQM